jgi:DNA-binding CsgD family transcriptional regulator/PAS domain-containing protein
VIDADLNALTDIIYAAGTDPARWPIFLDRLGQLLAAQVVGIFVQDISTPGGAFSFSHGLAPEWQRAYRDYYAARNVWMIHGLDLQRVRTSEERYPANELRKTEFYADFLQRVDVFHGVGGTIFREGSLTANLTVLRKRGEFGAPGRNVIAALMPHLQSALRTYRRLAEAQLEEHAVLAALDRLSCGVLLVDRDARPVFVNVEARRIVAARDGLSIHRDGVAAARAGDTRALRSLVMRASTRGGGGGALVLGRPSGRRPLGIEVVPLVLGVEERPASHVVGVFVMDPERQQEPDETLLARLYELTPAEASLTARLATGDSLQEAAERQQIAHETARTHLKRILRKTGSRRQAELVMRVQRGPLGIAGGRDG